jgi:ectoine hydroxylase-related dioxygenase (phytanoyl-CoA dioxygenase family)
MQLSPESLDAYHRDGYAVVEDLLSAEEVEALRERLRAYTHGGRPPIGLKIQVEPRIERGELNVEHPGDGIRKIDFWCRMTIFSRSWVCTPISSALSSRLSGRISSSFATTCS